MAKNKLRRSELAGGWSRHGVGEHRLEINSNEEWDSHAESHTYTHIYTYIYTLTQPHSCHQEESMMISFLGMGSLTSPVFILVRPEFHLCKVFPPDP